ncbi:hypothetical protein [Pseudonocardia sp. TMWB2A]|uniref:hypothetical protein n=1 Tax=Pseudonocardia sp. TMWB2A TaxID=687430 RepID=UPI00307D94E3
MLLAAWRVAARSTRCGRRQCARREPTRSCTCTICGTPAAQTGATLREVMSRIGHGSARAALIYQHATSERDHRIAEALDLMIREARAAGEEAAS